MDSLQYDRIEEYSNKLNKQMKQLILELKVQSTMIQEQNKLMKELIHAVIDISKRR